jgi:hypothetical protein
MTITKSGLRTRALQLADAVSSPRWDTTATTGEVDVHMGMVHMREWRRILNANPYYRVARRTPAIDSSGRIAISSLSDSSSADALETFYRVLMVAVNNTPYKEIIPKEGLLAGIQITTGSAMPGSNIWFRQGDYIMVPDAANSTATGVWVNHVPTPANLLSGEAIVVTFPDTYEDLLAYELAAILLSKGSAESDSAATMKAFAEDLRRDMLQDIARFSIAPQQFQFADTAAEWGG